MVEREEIKKLVRTAFSSILLFRTALMVMLIMIITPITTLCQKEESLKKQGLEELIAAVAHGL
jgi:hypothetical protein